jgi:membrane-associated phospholipid phosphatase
LLKGYWRAAVWSLIVIEVGRWSYVLLKAIFDRPRPEWAHPAAHAGGWSFPSGHATGIGAFAGVAIVLALMFSPTRELRSRLIGTGLVIAVSVGLDRILLGVHYPSDVVAGLVLGSSITLLALAAFDPLPSPGGAHLPPRRRGAEPGRTTIAP